MDAYRDAGVDLDAADALVDRIRKPVTATWTDDVVGGFGGFAGGLRLPAGYDSPVLMMSTDGVGTKAELARSTDMIDGLGWDLVAMCIDDLAAAGARAIAMTDYVATGSLDVDRMTRLVTSIAEACASAGVVLIGGETAEHPGVMAPDAFDLAGAALGVVEEGAQIDGSSIEAGDAIVAIDSPNLRSNGFSLVRALTAGLDLDAPLPGMRRPAAEVLLAPSVLYSPVVADLLALRPHGLVHITGGGIPGNVPRILPDHLDAVIDTTAWAPPDVFGALARLGAISQHDMFRTFNMGVGFIVMLPPTDVAAATDIIATHGRSAFVIGEIVPGSGAAKLR